MQAHSFQVAFLAPVAGEQARVGRQALDGFLLAASERDGHPGQESDGHLGGLDVYVSAIDTSRDAQSVERDLRSAAAGDVQIVTGIIDQRLAETVRRVASETSLLLVPVPETSAADPLIPPAIDAAFQARFGYAPTRYAWNGYCAGRRVEQVVRPVAGDFSDRAGLSAALHKARCP